MSAQDRHHTNYVIRVQERIDGEGVQIMRKRKFADIILLSMAVAVYDIYYLITVFYVPFKASFGFTNTQMGALVSMNTVLSLVSLALSGWLCERFSPKICLAVSVTFTGFLSVWMSTMPSYSVMKLIYILMAVIHFCWASYVKCVHLLGKGVEQGKTFGFSTMIESIVSTVLFFVPTIIWGNGISEKENFSKILCFFGVFFMAVGISIALFFDYNGLLRRNGIEKSVKTPFKEIFTVIKMREVWLIAFIQFSSYSTLACLTYVSPYLNTVFAIPTAFAASFGIISRFGIRAVATPLGGILYDKVGSTAKCLLYISGITIVIFTGLIMLPQSEKYTSVAVTLTFAGFLGYMLNVNASNLTLGEIHPPEYLVGLIVGTAGTIANLSNLCVPVLAGNILDGLGNKGYRIVLGGICIFQGMSILSGYLLKRREERKT